MNKETLGSPNPIDSRLAESLSTEPTSGAPDPLVNTDNPFLPFALPDITEREIEAVADSMRSGWLTTGPNASAFEREFADFLGGGDLQAVAVNSATAGLHLALEALGIGPGDEVLVPTWTFTSTAEVVRYLGATPVLVDVDPHTLNIDLAAAERAITRRTRAIMPVHFAGLPVSGTDLSDLAFAHNLAQIEDAAHAFPVRQEGRLIGDGTSDAVVFSFYATKTITTGEGGMLVTRNPRLSQRARTMRLHGISRDIFSRYTSAKPSWQYEVVAPGFKYNMTDTAAALGRVQLSRAWQMRSARERIAHTYDKALLGLPIELPARGIGVESHAWHLYVIQLTDDAPVTRDEFIELMAVAGIGTSVHFIPLHLHPYWRDYCQVEPKDFPAASEAFSKVVSLPTFSSMSGLQVDRVIRSTRRILGS